VVEPEANPCQQAVPSLLDDQVQPSTTDSKVNAIVYLRKAEKFDHIYTNRTHVVHLPND